MTPTEPKQTAEPIQRPRYSRLGIGLLISLATPRSLPQFRSRPAVEPRPCIVCGELHAGNNAFCSADCCRLHKSR